MTRKLAYASLALTMALLMNTTSLAQDGEGEALLYDRLGGLMPITVVVSDFLDELIPDAELNENPAIASARKRVPAAYLKYRVTAFVCEATGGPCVYQGKGMLESHEHLNITASEWDRMVTIFRSVLARHAVPEREAEELVQLLGTTREAIVTADRTRAARRQALEMAGSSKSGWSRSLHQARNSRSGMGLPM